ncbi:CLUMA_CG014105, isoform A [Clunio marinus]|uniref:CLUMA_CG014105, isoform A n=1 Tax=Clunio marinus TaxID=568069 RepID=A0A1J1IP52_9DIPT|nr:CLUMA_CG014105, isoform A [Clunio marinus]
MKDIVFNVKAQSAKDKLSKNLFMCGYVFIVKIEQKRLKQSHISKKRKNSLNHFFDIFSLTLLSQRIMH